MNERAFRLDFFIAIGALVVSILTMATLVYQTRVIEDQYSAAIWPYVGITTYTTATSYQLTLTNDGLGPALIRSAQLYIDNKTVQGWGQYETAIKSDPQVTPHNGSINFSMSSLDRTTTIRPSETMQVLLVKLTGKIPYTVFARHKIALALCYCSLNNRCWNLYDAAATSPGNLPVPVNGCSTSAHVDANAV